jgi:hypothetical protein
MSDTQTNPVKSFAVEVTLTVTATGSLEVEAEDARQAINIVEAMDLDELASALDLTFGIGLGPGAEEVDRMVEQPQEVEEDEAGA